MTSILGISVEVPNGRMHAAEMAARSGLATELVTEKSGVDAKAVVRDEEELWSLAERAARAALVRTGTHPEEIRYVVFASTGVRNKTAWSPAAHLMRRLSIRHGFGFNIENGCGSTVTALHVLDRILLSAPGTKALLIAADSLSPHVDYGDPTQLCLFNCADGAAAAVLGDSRGGSEIIGFSGHTRPEFSESMWLERGAQSFWLNDDAEEDRLLIESYREEYPARIRECIASAGLAMQDVRYLVANQGDHRLLDKLPGILGIGSEKIIRTHREFGHLGSCDVLFGYETAIQRGIEDGDVLVMAGSGAGFSWNACAVRYTSC